MENGDRKRPKWLYVFFGVEARVLQTKQLNLKAFHQKMLLLVIFFSPLVCVCVFASVPDV